MVRAAWLSLALCGCTRVHEVGSPAESDTTLEAAATRQCLQAVGRRCPPDSEVTYGTFAATFLSTHCLPCHGAPPEDDTDIEVAPRKWSFLPVRDLPELAIPIYEAAADDNTSQPPPGRRQIPPEDRERLGDWIACCMPGLPF